MTEPNYYLFGVAIPADDARAADDGVTVREPNGECVTRWLTETAKRPKTDGGPSVTGYLRSKGEL